MRNFTATVKERQPGQPCFVMLELDTENVRLEVDGDIDVARRVADVLNGTVVQAHRRLLSSFERNERANLPGVWPNGS